MCYGWLCIKPDSIGKFPYAKAVLPLGTLREQLYTTLSGYAQIFDANFSISHLQLSIISYHNA